MERNSGALNRGGVSLTVQTPLDGFRSTGWTRDIAEFTDFTTFPPPNGSAAQ